jgi:biotin synthase-related radical SAM superfamily protein
MIDNVGENPALLKLDLYCRGIRLGESCRVTEDGGREIMRTRAGLGSGLEVILPGGLYTNIPVAESFAEGSPYELVRDGGGYVIQLDGRAVAPVRLTPRPQWYGQRTSSGKKMSTVGSMQGTYLAIYPARVCDYWVEKPDKTNCKFCSVGLNLGCDDADEKSVADVLETVGAAVRENRITYLDFNTGHYDGDTYLDILEPYIRAVKQEYGLMIGVQTPPHHDLARYKALKKMGINRVSFCFEIWDRERFAEICPGKNREYGLDRYLEAIEYCSRVFHTTNGEIVVGLEPPEKSIEAINWITSVGAVPTVCVFRPLIGTDYEHLPPPKTEELVPVFRRMYEACMERSLMIGVAPNVKVSLVLLPEEGRYFTDDPNRFIMTRAKHALLRPVFAAALRARLV